MQEVLGDVYNLMLDLERIKFLSQENDSVAENEKTAEIKYEMQQYLRQWTERVEESVKHMDLPQEVVGQVLELTAEAKNLGSMNAIHTIARKVEAVLNEVRAYEGNQTGKNQAGKEQGIDINPTLAGAVIGGVALAPFVQVRYTPEAYEEKSEEYVEKQLMDRMIRGDYRPVPENRTYAPPKVSSRPEKATQIRHEIEQLEEEIALEFMIEQARRKGVTLSKDDAARRLKALAAFDRKHLMKQAEQKLGVGSDKKQLLAQKRAEEEKAYADRLRLNIIKQRKKKEIQEQKRLRRAEREKQALLTRAAQEQRREAKADAILKAGKVKIRKSSKKRTKTAPKRTVKKELSSSLKERMAQVAKTPTKSAPNPFTREVETSLAQQMKESKVEQAVAPAQKRVRREAGLNRLLAEKNEPVHRKNAGGKKDQNSEQLKRILKDREYALAG